MFNSQCTDSMLNFSLCQFEVYSMDVSKMVNDSPEVLNLFLRQKANQANAKK